MTRHSRLRIESRRPLSPQRNELSAMAPDQSAMDRHDLALYRLMACCRSALRSVSSLKDSAFTSSGVISVSVMALHRQNAELDHDVASVLSKHACVPLDEEIEHLQCILASLAWR